MNKVNPIIIDLLRKRGIVEESDLQEFLSEKPQKTYDPFLLLNLEAGVDLLLSAIDSKKKICIYGDYDADGITSISILWEFLSQLTENLEYYIPSRFDEGYGLNKEAIKKIKEGGAQILLTVDCGSVSYEEVEYAKELGLEVVVTDHHRITDTAADCILINPKQAACSYPFKDLAGCGVAFKLVQAIRQRKGLPKRMINSLLDLVAIGTIGDIVPLLDENRTLVKHGMHIVNSGARPGLKKLIEEISLTPGKVKSDQVAFGIVPHLNAAGRMMDAKIGVELLTGRETAQISENVNALKQYNQERKNTQEKAYKNCLAIIEELHRGENFLIIRTEDTHEGIAGIVAGKLKDRYSRPTILVTPSGEGFLKGTGRSIPTVDLYRTLKQYDNFFERFGGHEGACGFLMREENLEPLSQKLEAEMMRRIKEEPNLFDLQADADLELLGGDVKLEFAQELECLAPFGSKNPKPYFALENVRITRPYPMGKDGTHIRFNACCPDGSTVECVLFNKAKDYQPLIYGEKPINLLGNVDFQEWKGNKKVQFMVDSMIQSGREEIL